MSLEWLYLDLLTFRLQYSIIEFIVLPPVYFSGIPLFKVNRVGNPVTLNLSLSCVSTVVSTFPILTLKFFKIVEA